MTNKDKLSLAFGILIVVGAFIILSFSIQRVRLSLLSTPAPGILGVAEPVFCYDPLDCIRDVGETLGVDNKTIMKMIRIARAESKCNTLTNKNCTPDNGVVGIGLDPKAKNPGSTATGIFQILIGTWKSNRCTGDIMDFKDNTWCGYKIMAGQGEGAWNASRRGWDD